jgi:D-glycero-D-manno-heptose 1,7-bisphosphate phosphatase
MLLQASKELNIDLKKSYFIGDRNKDIYAGNKVKCKTIFIDFNYNERKPKRFFLCSKSLVKGFNLLNKDISEILKKHKKILN